ncbi:molybdopterin-dependent oxidoreductase [Falsiroseomonas sp.]|uniref:molybdopterin-dependent oxidoreductase n=1 Tax=Falsiroseomonas sp. TaxID=2870721 RepID=UPI003F6F8FC0
MRRRRLAILPLVGALAGFAAQAQPGGGAASPAQGRIILRVSGRIAGGTRDFDLAGLEALGLQDLHTETRWTGSEVRRFSGVPLARLLQAVSAQGETLRAQALNDYAVTLPRQDADRNGALLATRQDGAPLRIRDRGPIWLIYPWTDRPELDLPIYRDRAIWQVRSIDVI